MAQYIPCALNVVVKGQTILSLKNVLPTFSNYMLEIFAENKSRPTKSIKECR